MENIPLNSHPNVQTALAAVMLEIEGLIVQKKRSDGLNYAFASIDDMIAVVRPALVRHGVVIYPSGTRELVRTEAANSKGTMMTTVSGLFSFTFCHGESFIVVEVPGEVKDSSDKANAKALTAAYKYALKQTFMIEVGDERRQRPTAETKEGKKAPTGPLDPQTFRTNYLRKVEKREGGIAASTEQARYVASLMSEAYKSTQATDGDRIRVLSWLVNREIASTGQITQAEASVLIERITETEGGKLSPSGHTELVDLLDYVIGPVLA